MYTVLFALLIILTLVLMVFGKALVKLLVKFAPFFGKFDGAFNFGRQFAALLLFFFVFDLLYTVLPNRPSHLLFEMPEQSYRHLVGMYSRFFYSMYMQKHKKSFIPLRKFNCRCAYDDLAVFLHVYLLYRSRGQSAFCPSEAGVGSAEQKCLKMPKGGVKSAMRQKIEKSKSKKRKRCVKMEKQFILFDLDGTLTDSGEGITKSVAYAVESLGYAPLSPNTLREFIGPPLFGRLSRVCKYAGGDCRKSCPKIQRKISRHRYF